METNYLQKRSVFAQEELEEDMGKLADNVAYTNRERGVAAFWRAVRRRSLSAPTGSIPLSESRFAQSLAGVPLSAVQ